MIGSTSEFQSFKLPRCSFFLGAAYTAGNTVIYLRVTLHCIVLGPRRHGPHGGFAERIHCISKNRVGEYSTHIVRNKPCINQTL